MKIALLGYGKMGKEIEKIATDRNHQIVLLIDINNPHELTSANLKKADVAIDFSVPVTAYQNIMACFEAGIPIVSGTTGWLDRYDEVVAYCKKNAKTFFYASNYSIGANVFFEINRRLAELMDRFPEYDVTLKEVHHIHKLDAPSGTALTIAGDIIKNLGRKKNWQLNQNEQPEVLQITAVREGEVPGIHEVKYDSPVDFIEIKHSAKSRKGLALGAVLCAEYIHGRTGYYTMKEFMQSK